MLLKEGGSYVKAIDERPVLLDGLDFYFQGYQELKYDAVSALGEGYIPWSCIINWCKLHGICDINDISTVMRYFRSMENAELEYKSKKEKAKKNV